MENNFEYMIKVLVSSRITPKNLSHFYNDLMTNSNHVRFHEFLNKLPKEDIYKKSRQLVNYRDHQEEEEYGFTHEDDRNYDNMMLHFAVAIYYKDKTTDQIVEEWLTYVAQNEENKKQFETIMKKTEHQKFHKNILELPVEKIKHMAKSLQRDRIDGFLEHRQYSSSETNGYNNMILHFAMATEQLTKEQESLEK